MGNEKLIWFELFAWIALGTIVIAFLSGLRQWARLGKLQRMLVILLAIALLTELLSAWLNANNLSSFPTFHVYAILEYGLLVFMYSSIFRSGLLKNGLKVSIVLMTLFGVINFLLLQPISEPNTNVTITSSVILISLSLLLFRRMLNEMTYSKIEKSALFWMNIGVLIYFASSFVLFTFLGNIWPIELEGKINVYLLNTAFNIIHYLCFTIALWMKPE